MKRIICLLLVFALLLPCVGLKAEAATSGSCGKNVTWKFDSETGTLTISGTGAMKNYDWELEEDWSPWTEYADKIQKVVIRKGVTSIGDSAFEGSNKEYTKLKTVTIPNSVTSIGATAFSCCDSLTSITIPDSVTSIGWGAFSSCDSLTSVTIPGSVTIIDDYTFEYCKSLTSVTIPDSVISIGEEAFRGCESLTSVTIPDSVTSIGEAAFKSCDSLTSVMIPDSVTSIGKSAFMWCDSLTSVTISDSVTFIASFTFEYCESLTSVTIPVSIRAIDADAFWYCKSLKDVYYGGSPSQSEAISIDYGNDRLTNATWHYGAEDPLLAPAVQAATKASTGKPRLSWEAVDGADFYRIYCATSRDGVFSYLKSTRSTAFTDTSAKTGSCYYYKVKAVEEETKVTSAFSNTVRRCCDLPRPVASVTVNASTGKPKLTWEAVDGAQCYRIYRRTAGNDYVYLDSTGSTAFADKTAEAGVNYYYQVKAIHENENANSARSLSVNRACDLPKPVITVSLKNGDPQITWEKIDGAEKYRVYRATSKTGEYELVKSTVTATAFTDTSAEAGQTYYYKVRALHSNSAANSAWSAVKSITAK